MRDKIVLSVLIGALIAFFVMFVGGLLLIQFLADRVTFVDPNTTDAGWQSQFQIVTLFAASITSFCCCMWLGGAHRGTGVDKRNWLWLSALAICIIANLVLFRFCLPELRDGWFMLTALIAVLSFLSFWLATLLMTPSHYKFVPWFATQILPNRAHSR